MQHPESLMARVLKGRYFYDTNLLNATQKKKASYVWKSILCGRDLLKQGLRFVIGNGDTVNAWSDPWLSTYPPCAPRAKIDAGKPTRVSEWINATGSGWNEDRLHELVAHEDILKIL